MNFYLYVFCSFSHFVETQCVNITTAFSSGKIGICSACKAKYVAVNLFVACSTSLKKKISVDSVDTVCHCKLPEKKNKTEEMCKTENDNYHDYNKYQDR
jgi:hypothetical protein